MVATTGGRRLRPIHYFEEAVAGTALVVLVATVCWGVLTRYITATPAAWTGDISSVTFAWLIFMGSAAAFKYGMHMSIDLVWVLIPAAPRRWLGALVDLGILVFLGYATWLGVGFCLATLDDPLPILRWPRAVLYAAVMTGFGCMALRYAGLAWRRFRGNDTPPHRLPEPPQEGGAGWA
jgi:TRAP-type C4-dicarboxylate transport system permease small subunit